MGQHPTKVSISYQLAVTGLPTLTTLQFIFPLTPTRSPSPLLHTCLHSLGEWHTNHITSPYLL